MFPDDDPLTLKIDKGIQENENVMIKELLEENKNMKETLEIIRNTLITSNQELINIKNEFLVFKNETNSKFSKLENLIISSKLEKTSSFSCNNGKYDYIQRNEDDYDHVFNTGTHISLPLYSDMRNHEF